MNYVEECRRKAIAQIRLIRGEADRAIESLIRDVDEFQISFITPKNFHYTDPENFIKKLELSFEHLCTTLEELGVNRPQDLSTFSFYSKIAYFKKKKKPK